MKKKILALLLALAMTASLAGCGLAATKTPENSDSPAPSTTPADATEVGPYGSSAETQGKTNPIVVKVSNGAGETSPGVKAPAVRVRPHGREQLQWQHRR